MPVDQQKQTKPGPAYSALRIVVLALFVIVTAIVAVSFAANHLRLGFEKEFREQMNHKMVELAQVSSLLIKGDDLVADPNLAQAKYSAALPAMVVDSDADNQIQKEFGLYAYTNGSLVPLLQSQATGLRAMEVPVSSWLTTEAGPYYIYDSDTTVILTPIKDSTGKVTGLYELSATYSFLDTFGSQVERNVLFAVLVSISAGILVFSFQYLVPILINIIRKKGGKMI
jgi:hypothetical protein